MDSLSKGSQFQIRKPEYLESYDNFKDPTSFKPIVDVVEKYLENKNPSAMRCLDAMAGTGLVGRKIKEKFSEIDVVYQDRSPKMLSSDVYQGDSKRVLSDATALGMTDKSFDIVFCRAGLNNVKKEDYKKILQEYLRVLSANGIAILMDHFAQTEEEKKVINQIETEIKTIEGINDEVYVPTMEELKKTIQDLKGKVVNAESFRTRFSLKERFASKGIKQPDLANIIKILKSQNSIKYEEVDNDVILMYPITTITFSKF